MGSMAPIKRNPLAAGFYTVPDAARLIEIGDPRRIYGWLRGYPQSAMGPLLNRDYTPIKGQADEELSFLDLMEIRAVEFFRANGVKSRTLRRAIEEARVVLKTTHPFATRNVTFKADDKFLYLDELLKQSAKAEGDTLLYNLVTKRYESLLLIKDSISTGVEYNPSDNLPIIWTPRVNFPKITINPKISYGRPALPSGIATATLYNSWLAEGKNYDEVAFWFGMPVNDVHQAIEFENEIAKAA